MKVMKTYCNFLLPVMLLFLSNCGGGEEVIDPIIDPPEPPSSREVSMEFDIDHELIYSESKVQDRNFYLFTLIEALVEVSEAIASDEVFSNFLETSKQRIRTVLETSNPTVQNYADVLKFTDDEIASLSLNLKELVQNTSVLHNMVKDHMGPSGAFQLFSDVSTSDRIVQLAFEEAAQGINHIIDVYVAGHDPKYPDIDRVSFEVNSNEYRSKLKNELNALNEESQTLFFQPSLQFALRALALNNRDEAGRYFPLESGENEAAVAYLKTVNWDDFEYAFALALGDGPNEPDDEPNISVGGKRNADQAVSLYQQNKVPLVVMSGGHVKPFQVPYSEGIEMKKYVMEAHNIPENRILVETQARHTTTNLRNTGRLVYRYGIPSNKKAIVTSSSTHINTIESSNFNVRSLSEMNHIPAEIHSRISNIYLEFTPEIEVLHLDSSDPLDP